MARPIVMPSFGMYTVEGTILQWLKEAGASVEAGEPVLELETEKAVAEVTAPESGILHHVVEPGAIVQVESLLGYVLAPGEAPPLVGEPRAAPAADVPIVPTVSVPTFSGVLASPNAKRVAAELGVDLDRLTGTGPGGRITEDDVRAAAGGAG